VSPVVVGVPTFDDAPFGFGTKALPCPEFAVAVMFPGQEIVGAAVSTTVTLKLHPPPPVEDVVTTVVVPIGKNEPEAGLLVIVPQVPKPSAELKVTFAPPPAPWVVAVLTTSFGQSSVQSPPGVPLTTVPVAVALLSGV
jgi:hypothetical protein